MASKKSNGESYGKGRTRSWTFIVYPDSAPENWRSILDEDHIQWIESPLHDKDLNADNEFDGLMLQKRRKSLALCPKCYEEAKLKSLKL